MSVAPNSTGVHRSDPLVSGTPWKWLRRFLSVAVVAVFLLGFRLATWAVRHEDRLMRDRLLQQAYRVARTIPADRLEGLSGTPEDLESPLYRELKGQLAAIGRANPDWAWIYVARRSTPDTVVVQVDSMPYDAPDARLPGDALGAGNPGLRQVFETGLGSVVGPFGDGRGRWISAHVPLRSAKGDQLLGILGMDVNAAGWRFKTLQAGVVPALFSLFWLWIVLHGRHLIRHEWMEGLPKEMRRRHREMVQVLLAGAVLTGLAAWRVLQTEERRKEDIFASLCNLQIEQVFEGIRRLESMKLEGLARFIGASEEVNPDEFALYADQFSESTQVAAWGWADRVRDSERKVYEGTCRTRFGESYRIFEHDRFGSRVDAATRDWYYPVRLLVRSSPSGVGCMGPGCDLGAERLFRNTLEHAALSGRTSASDPALLVGRKKGRIILIVRPGLVGTGAERRLGGFAFAVVRPEDLLAEVDVGQRENRQFLNLDFLQLHQDQAPTRLATVGSDCAVADPGHGLAGKWLLSAPILAFGKAYAVAGSPSVAFRRISSGHLLWGVLAAGLFCTTAFAMLFRIFATRSETLSRLVARKTADLAEVIEQHNALARHSRAYSWKVDVNGLYTAVSGFVEELLGYRPEDLVGRKHFFDLHPADGREDFREQTLAMFGRGESLRDMQNPVVTRSGEVRWVLTNGLPVFDDAGELLGYHGNDSDFTERRRTALALKESEERYRMLTENMKHIVWIVDPDTMRYRYVSASIQSVLGYSVGEAMAFEDVSQALVPEDREAFLSMVRQRCGEVRTGTLPSAPFVTVELRHACRDGRPLWTEQVLQFVWKPETGQVDVQGVTRDISFRKQAEMYHAIDIDVLLLFEGSDPMDVLFDRACRLIQERTGLDGVGIRMRMGDDCPYAARCGELCRLGDGLVVRDMNGKPIRDSQGGAHLKCLCGLVLAGNLRSETSVFTSGGSVWSNDIGRLLSLPCVGGLDTFCAKNGRGSLALVPIREKKSIVGILQLLDARTDCFTAEVVEILETIAGHIGEALLRRRAERDYRLLFNGMVEGFVLLEVLYDKQRNPQDFKFLAVNPQFERMTGLKRAMVEGRKASEFLAAGELRWIPTFGKVVTTGEPVTFLHSMASNGRSVEITAFEPASDQVAAIFNDVTKRVVAERERERLIQAIEQSAETVMITDAAGLILYVNPTFSRITGYSREEAIGQTPRILKSGVEDPAVYRAMWEALSTGRTWSGELTNRKKDGSLYYEQATISPVLDAGGNTVNYVAVKTDITERKKAEEENRNLQSQLSQIQKMESIGRLAGGIAHDFNNMLQAILGYTELAMEQVQPGIPLHRDLTEIQNAARRSSVLTRQLQAFARKQSISPQVIDLNEMMEGMLGILHRMIGENIHLDWRPAPLACRVFMDSSQIDQIVTNLCVNARDAVGPDGHIHVATEIVTVSAEDHALLAEGLEPGRFVRLSVSDDGCGMPPDVLNRIFEPFFTTKKVGAGTGLGLPTVYGIVKQNKGAIQVASNPGKGTEFQIFLPENLGNGVRPAPGDANAMPVAGQGETILIVEDEGFILHAAQRMLESLGYTVLVADSPTAALKIFAAKKNEIHLVLSDVIMPGMSGPEVVAKMVGQRPGLKCVYMSGYTANFLSQHGVEESERNFMHKPFSRQKLAETVRAALDA